MDSASGSLLMDGVESVASPSSASVAPSSTAAKKPATSTSSEPPVGGEGEEGWRRSSVAKNAKFYTSTHKIDFVEWNPRHTVCAVASDKGEVSVRRVQGKQGWRAELSGEPGLLWSDDAELRKSTTTLLALCWSPDGDVLACSMNSGLVHYLDVESGRIKFTLRVEKPFKMLKWFQLEDLRNVRFADYDHLALCKTPEFNVKGDAQMTREETKELEDLEDFVNQTLPNVLVPTILVGATEDDALVEVFAAGVTPIARFAPNAVDFPSNCTIDPMSFEVKAFHMDPRSRDPQRLWIAYSVVGQTAASGDQKAAFGHFTFLLGYDLRLNDGVYVENVMTLAKRHARLLYAVILLREIYGYMVKDWKVQSSIFQSRLKVGTNTQTGVKGPVVDYCTNLLDVILTGQMSNLVFTFLHDNAKEIKIKEMHKFLDERFSDLIKILSGPLTAAGNIIHYQVVQLLQEFIAFKESDRFLNSFEINIEIGAFPSVPKAPQPTLLDYTKQREFQSAKESAILLGRRIFETKIVSFANRKDLKALVKFLAICPPFLQHLKQPRREEMIRANDTFDAKTLINYIIATFGEYMNLENNEIRAEYDDPLEQVLVKLRCIEGASKENPQLHAMSIQQEAEDPRLDRVDDYFGDTFEKDHVPKELELNAEWTPMWAEHHGISTERYDELKDSYRTLKQSVDLIRKTFVELTDFVGRELRSEQRTFDAVMVEMCNPRGYEKVVLASWEDATEEVPRQRRAEEQLNGESQIAQHIPVEAEKEAIRRGVQNESGDIPRIIFMGKRPTKSEDHGHVCTFVFDKNGKSTPMTNIGMSLNPPESQALQIGVNPWDAQMQKEIVDFEYFKNGMVVGVAKFPERTDHSYLFKQTVFSPRGFVDVEATKNRRIEKVVLSPKANVGIAIVPPFSKNTTSSKFGMFEI
ncbi:hypothetical protein QR680_009763 [Steinernema hermaphroditum]|uniref:Anaphase-promoting complex subunit 4-like WD40 domain-containing protein n=1 Tax=Steinernema hermaphroditum TaxID=289476 RepID=A0AA39IMV5_9BILA|nr:hypothetical protein QR680_009763 [Steinernema hermaphroditum]